MVVGVSGALRAAEAEDEKETVRAKQTEFRELGKRWG